MNSYYHAVITAKKHGGIPEDYQMVHDFIDSSKAAIADVRHRAMLHSAWGIFLCEQLFGHTVPNSEGKQVPVRIIAEEHIMEDLGFIPTVEHWLSELPIRKWMSGTVKKTKIVPPTPPASRFEKRGADLLRWTEEGVSTLKKIPEEETFADSAVSIYRKSLKVKD